MDTELLAPGPTFPQATSVADEALASGEALQQIKTSYATAISVQRPREIEQVRKRFLQEARLAGETFYYGWATKGKKKGRIEGPSIGLAVAAARCWGNCAVEPLPVQDMKDSWVFGTAFIDLETGFTMGRQFRQSKRSTVYGDMDKERKDDIRFQIGQSKSARNVICKAVPKWLVDQGIAEAKQGVREKVEVYVSQHGIQAATDVILQALKKEGVTEAQVLAKCEVAATGAITVDHIVSLKGDLVAIQTGEDRVDALFPDLDDGTLADQLSGKSAPSKKPAEPKHPSEPATDANAGAATDTQVPDEGDEASDILAIDYRTMLDEAETSDDVAGVVELIQAETLLTEKAKQNLVRHAEHRLDQIAPKKPGRAKKHPAGALFDKKASATEAGA
jgi:hypothetical protein